MTYSSSKKAPRLAGMGAIKQCLGIQITNQARNHQHGNRLARAGKCNTANAYIAYEECKRRWDTQNPNASSVERDFAMTRIARACGV